MTVWERIIRRQCSFRVFGYRYLYQFCETDRRQTTFFSTYLFILLRIIETAECRNRLKPHLYVDYIVNSSGHGIQHNVTKTNTWATNMKFEKYNNEMSSKYVNHKRQLRVNSTKRNSCYLFPMTYVHSQNKYRKQIKMRNKLQIPDIRFYCIGRFK